MLVINPSWINWFIFFPRFFFFWALYCACVCHCGFVDIRASFFLFTLFSCSAGYSDRSYPHPKGARWILQAARTLPIVLQPWSVCARCYQLWAGWQRAWQLLVVRVGCLRHGNASRLKDSWDKSLSSCHPERQSIHGFKLLQFQLSHYQQVRVVMYVCWCLGRGGGGHAHLRPTP